MESSKTSLRLIFKKAPFPAIMTVISFLLFIFAYMLLTLDTVYPYYLEGLVFALPFIAFGLTTFLSVTGKLKKIVSEGVTGVLVIVFIFTSIFFAFDICTTTTTDINKYGRVLKVTNYPENSLIAHFPDKIPDNAENTVFIYSPGFLQGGTEHGLKFNTDSESIENYINELSEKAKWIGTSGDSQAGENGVFIGTLGQLGYTVLPEDFTIYIISSEPYKPNDWNHGELSLAAISQQRNEILFFAEDW